MTDAPINARVLEYIARETARHYGPPEADLTTKLRRNVRRNFKVSISEERMTSLIERYKAMYAYAASVLNKYLTPVPGTYADWSHVRMPAYASAVQRRFKHEPPFLVKVITDYAVYYEYLR